jgi:hypothetical protein
MQKFHEFVENREKDNLKEYVQYCLKNKIGIDENDFTSRRGFLQQLGATAAAALGASSTAAQYLTPAQAARRAEIIAKNREKHELKQKGQTGKSQKDSSTDKGKTGEFNDEKEQQTQEEHIKRALKGFKNVNKFPVFQMVDLEEGFRNPGHNVFFALRDGKNKPTNSVERAALHSNHFNVPTIFNAKSILKTQAQNPRWEYIPAFNMFYDKMAGKQEKNGELYYRLYNPITGKDMGTVANFFGLSISRDGKITPRSPQHMP